MTDIIILTPELAKQLETIRREGHFNMFDFNGVHRRANDLEFYQMVTWMNDNHGKWASLVMNGFMVDMGDGGLVDHKEYFEQFEIETEIEDNDDW